MKYAKNIQYDIKVVEKEITLIDLDENGNPIGTLKEIVKEEIPLFRTEYFEYGATEEELAELNKPMPREVEIEQIRTELASYDYIGVKLAMGVATREEYADKIEHTERLRERLRELEESL